MTSPFSTVHPWNLVAEGYAAENVPVFTAFADRALSLAEVAADAEVLDVATGPGSLAVQAAPAAAKVVAVDFSPAMLKQCCDRILAAGCSNVHVLQGDGQALPFEDASFDRAFSMFGLMFFPDRHRGFAELHRVLRSGGRAIVSSWEPMDTIPAFVGFFEALFDVAPQLRPDSPPLSVLSTPAAVEAEMGAAGFDVTVHRVDQTRSYASPAEFFASLRRGFAGVKLFEEALGDGFDAAWTAAITRFVDTRGNGPVEMPFRALFGVGKR